MMIATDIGVELKGRVGSMQSPGYYYTMRPSGLREKLMSIYNAFAEYGCIEEVVTAVCADKMLVTFLDRRIIDRVIFTSDEREKQSQLYLDFMKMAPEERIGTIFTRYGMIPRALIPNVPKAA